MDAFVGLIILRKLCNHPDLVTGGPNRHGDYDVDANEDVAFGAVARSGKMQLLRALLRLWQKQKHKVLVFSQSRQMLTILETFVRDEGYGIAYFILMLLLCWRYSYLRMDGTTNIGSRQTLVTHFNEV
jgi:DNA excision repair protein ERCC-6